MYKGERSSNLPGVKNSLPFYQFSRVWLTVIAKIISPAIWARALTPSSLASAPIHKVLTAHTAIVCEDVIFTDGTMIPF